MDSQYCIPKTVLYFDNDKNQWNLAKSDICVHQILGEKIDLKWNFKGQLKIRKSQY